MHKTISAFMILSFLVTSCCSITRDPTSPIAVTAQQRDADVFIDGYACGTTPLSVDLDKTCDHQIIVSKPGYQRQRICLKSRHTASVASNLISPTVGAVVGTGAGLALYGTGGYIFPAFLVGTVIGGAIGLGIGCIGTAADLYLRSDCDLDRNNVHFHLIPEKSQGTS